MLSLDDWLLPCVDGKGALLESALVSPPPSEPPAWPPPEGNPVLGVGMPTAGAPPVLPGVGKPKVGCDATLLPEPEVPPAVLEP